MEGTTVRGRFAFVIKCTRGNDCHPAATTPDPARQLTPTSPPTYSYPRSRSRTMSSQLGSYPLMPQLHSSMKSVYLGAVPY